MWFDAQSALAEIQAGGKPGFDRAPRATRATCATRTPEMQPGVAHVARVARPRGSNPEITPCASDAETYLAVLHRSGPQTYGAMASILSWGATRAWQTEARLRAAGLVRYGALGKAQPTERNTHDRP